jgi:hypothetical protein
MTQPGAGGRGLALPAPHRGVASAVGRMPETFASRQRAQPRRSLRSYRYRISRRNALGQIFEDRSHERASRRRWRPTLAAVELGRQPDDQDGPTPTLPAQLSPPIPRRVARVGTRAKLETDLELVEDPGQRVRTHRAGRDGGGRVVRIDLDRSAYRQRSLTPGGPVRLRQPVGEQ